jgi:hypothetical protein
MLLYILVLWNILRPLGIYHGIYLFYSHIFPSFGISYQEKSGNPGFYVARFSTGREKDAAYIQRRPACDPLNTCLRPLSRSLFRLSFCYTPLRVCLFFHLSFCHTPLRVCPSFRLSFRRTTVCV